MITSFSLKKRIIIAFTIQTVFIALIAFSTISLYVDYIEETVLYEHLSHYLDAYVDEIDSDNRPVIPADIQVYVGDQLPLPEYALNLAPGGHEIVLENGSAYHVMNKYYDGRLVTLIKDQTAFETKEATINFLTLFVLSLFVIVSFLFSKSLADRIVHPICNLAEKVSGLTVDNFESVSLDYPKDEIGVLVKVIYDHINTLNHYLQREKWFTGDISHELRTPMMVVSSSLDLLKMESTTEEQRKQIYKRIEGAVTSVNELISTFLLLARGKAGEQEKVLLSDLPDLTHEIIGDLKVYLGNKNISFKTVVESPEELVVNASLFSIVLTNLIKNAIFNMDQGEIVVTLREHGFMVADTGKGLPKMVKQFVNDKMPIKSHRNNSHLGLGISIIKRICEREGWSIVAYDGKDSGACFMIDFEQ